MIFFVLLNICRPNCLRRIIKFVGLSICAQRRRYFDSAKKELSVDAYKYTEIIFFKKRKSKEIEIFELSPFKNGDK